MHLWFCCSTKNKFFYIVCLVQPESLTSTKWFQLMASLLLVDTTQKQRYRSLLKYCDLRTPIRSHHTGFQVESSLPPGHLLSRLQFPIKRRKIWSFVRCLAFTEQNDVWAQFYTRRSLLELSAESGKVQKQKVLYGNLLKWICIDIEGSWLLIEPFLGKKKRR